MRWTFSIDLILPHTMALGLTQPLTEMSTRNLSAECLEKMWEPRRLTSPWAFPACCRGSFIFYHTIYCTSCIGVALLQYFKPQKYTRHCIYTASAKHSFPSWMHNPISALSLLIMELLQPHSGRL
jgi:hypothetical protein